MTVTHDGNLGFALNAVVRNSNSIEGAQIPVGRSEEVGGRGRRRCEAA
jgi:hypothetical protein